MIKTIKENIILHNKFFKVYNNDVIFKNGKIGTHLKIELPINKGIAVIPFNSNFEVIIQDEYRYAKESMVTQIVKGGVKDGQTFEDAVKEELSEELNLTYEKLIYAGKFDVNPSLYNQENRAYIALNCNFKDELICNDGTESFDNLRVIKFTDLLDDCINGRIECAVTQMLVLKAAFLLDL